MTRTSGKILIVDDVDVVLKLEEILLKRTGSKVLKARDGREALRLIQEECPDIILLDLVMPELGGDIVTRFVKQAPETKDATVIIVTARGDDATEERCREAGADYFLTKPIRHDELLRIVREELQRRDLNSRAGI
ncbi:MAG: response regulator [Candidatus Dadabacteria bacterium]|nr:MAG: response regulator [Candidatus Dadabacteria bacterium]